MRKVIKNKGNVVQAWRLGDFSKMEQKMLEAGKIRRTEEGGYELFSQEAVYGKGQPANKGDYFKVDSSGMPYPNDKNFFEKNHKLIGENTFIQAPKILDAWEAEDPVSEEIEFLLKKERLRINEDKPEKYFEAFLRGAPLAAAKNAVIIIRFVERNGEGKILDIDFDFIERKEFERTYQYVRTE